MKSGVRIRYRTLLVLAGAAVLWERFWPRLWPAVAVVSVFAAVALLNVLPALPDWSHVAVLVAFAVAAGLAIRHAVTGLRAVDRTAARHRLERDSDLSHRPLMALEDAMVTGIGEAGPESLWRTHVARMASVTKRLRVAAPLAGVDAQEPWGIRAAVVLVLAIGLATGGNEAGARLLRAIAPDFDDPARGPVSIGVWITPPAYTAVAPMFLHSSEQDSTPASTHAVTHDGEHELISVPAGSAVLAQVTGVSSTPYLRVGEMEIAFQPIGTGSDANGFRAEILIAGGNRLSVRSDAHELAGWPLNIVADSLPKVEFVRPPDATADGSLRFAFKALDDYGVAAVTAVIRPAEDGAAGGEKEQVRVEMPLPVFDSQSVEGSGIQDLTAHIWAGKPVGIRLEAEDVAGQTGASVVTQMVLPERVFTHPVARAVIVQRKKLFDASRAPRRRVAMALNAISSEPKHFANDVTVSLALSVAQARLVRDDRDRAVPSVRKILWNTALRIEQGSVPVAEGDLRDARQELWEALRRGADAAEIDRLMDELQAALDRYLDAVAAELARRGEVKPLDPQLGNILRTDDLRELIETARQLARTGARDSARRMLAELQRILDGIRAGLVGGDASKQLMEAHRLLNGIRGMAKRQEDLLDQTFRKLRELRAQQERGNRTQPNPQDPFGEGAAEQDALRSDLGELMLELDGFLGKIPAPIGEAGMAMRRAVKALQDGRGGDAIESQGEALDGLGRATDEAAEMMAQQLGGLSGMFANDPDEYEENGMDPFGRSAGGRDGLGIGDVKIPDQGEVRRAYQILQELQRRASERHRPTVERNYIDRLLKQF